MGDSLGTELSLPSSGKGKNREKAVFYPSKELSDLANPAAGKGESKSANQSQVPPKQRESNKNTEWRKEKLKEQTQVL